MFYSMYFMADLCSKTGTAGPRLRDKGDAKAKTADRAPSKNKSGA
jgi:hypothetical protein